MKNIYLDSHEREVALSGGILQLSVSLQGSPQLTLDWTLDELQIPPQLPHIGTIKMLTPQDC